MCLAEVMIALAAGAVVLSATFQSLNHFQHRLWAQHEAIARNQDLRVGMAIMETDLRAAGSGAPSLGVVRQAGSQEIEFLANLGGQATTLAESALPAQHEVSVQDGSDWPKGKRIAVCREEQCTESRLARDGRRTSLSLTSPLGQAFPAGSPVSVINQVRYYLGKDGNGKTRVMRMVDGGANPLIGEVASFRLGYLDRDGRPTRDPDRVARVRIELAVGDGRQVVTREVGLRGR